jgi:putative Mn2+ efflux pump MntP
VLFLSYFAGKICEGLITEQISDVLGFIIFFVIGLWKLAEYAVDRFCLKGQNNARQLNFKISGFDIVLRIYRNPIIADRDCSRTMSVPEGILFALAMSADGFFGGFGMWACAFEPAILLLNLPVTYLAVRLGAVTGHKLLCGLKYDLSWVGGAVFIALAFLR